MPILYIHGVGNRDREPFVNIEKYLRRLVAPSISAEPENVMIRDVFWGDAGVSFAWEGRSRPESRLLGMGAEEGMPPTLDRAVRSNEFQELLARIPAGPASGSSRLTSGQVSANSDIGEFRLNKLTSDQLSDLIAGFVDQTVSNPEERADLVLAADAAMPEIKQALDASASLDEEIEILLKKLEDSTPRESKLIGQGRAKNFFAGVGDRLRENLRRGIGAPTFVLSVALAELRRPLNNFISLFLGDVFVYLSNRGDAKQPGEIPSRLMAALSEADENKRSRNGEPLILLTHSMGGQVVYDMITHFLPSTPALSRIRVDFWCATASQVGFFEEMKLFLASDAESRSGYTVAFPDANLGAWWNVWDHNDFISYTARDIFSGVDDEKFETGMSLIFAHNGYLKCPSFYRKFARKLKEAEKNGWKTL